MVRTKNLAALIAVLSVLLLAGGTLYSDTASSTVSAETPAATSDSAVIQYVAMVETLDLAAGHDSYFVVFLTNNDTVTRFVLITVTNPAGTALPHSATDDKSTFELKAGATASVQINVANDKYAKAGSYDISIDIVSTNTSDTDRITEHVVMPMTVTSNLSSSEAYNKIMGLWTNPFSAPFDGPGVSALITAVLWLIIGYIVMLIAVPLTVAIVMKKNDPNRSAMKRTLYRLCWAIIILNAVGKGVRVLGVSEELVDAINVMFYIVYIIVGAMVAWRLYLIIANTLTERLDKDEFIPGQQHQPSSLLPLFKFIGEIVIAIAAVGGIMSLLGFNMTAIITSAGIVSLGITLGAQNILGQFFSGLVILATRPFKQGDLVQIGTNTVVYRVRRVTIMNTELENWDNTDITIVPNSTITGNFVKNITRETLKSKVHVYIDVAYGTDLDEAREVMKKVAYAHPRVVKDGSVDRPYTRVTAFEDSNIQLRLSAYVDDFNDSGTIGGELRQQMYKAFQDNGIGIDYTHIIVHSDAPDAPTQAKNDPGTGPEPSR